MSIKSSVKSLKMRPVLALVLLLTLCAAGLRTLQMLKMIDVQTGFYTDAFVWNRVLPVAVLCVALCSILYSFFSRDAGGRVANGLFSKAAGVFAAAFAAGLLFDCVQSYLQYRNTPKSVGGALQASFASGRFALFGEAIFALLAAVYFILFAVGSFQKKDIVGKQKLLALSPVLWAAMRMIHHFLIKISFVRVSDLFFELLLLGFMTLFFLYFAQVHSNIYRVGFEWRLFGFGLPAALIAGMLNLARLIVTFLQKDAVSTVYPLRPADLAFCLFAFAFLFALLKQPQDFPDPEEEKRRKEEEKKKKQQGAV